MTEPRNGLRAPADSGRMLTTDERIIRALRDEHRAHFHHENLCPACLVTAARLGEPMPEGRWIEPCWRAKVYATALHLAGAFNDAVLEAVMEAGDLTRDCAPGDGGYWFAANRLVAFLGDECYPVSYEPFEVTAWRAICKAVRPCEEKAQAGPDGFPYAALNAGLPIDASDNGEPSEADLDAMAAEPRAADLTRGCEYCGPVCYGGAAHHARKEDGVRWPELPGRPDLAAEEQVIKRLIAAKADLKAREVVNFPARASMAGEMLDPDLRNRNAASGNLQKQPGPQNAGQVGCPVDQLRCVECRRLRSATPRHERTCPKAGENCPGCVYAGEAHLRSCRLSLLFHLPEDDCCTGVDVPAIGCVHAHDCGNTNRRVLRASGTCAGTAGRGGAA